MGKIIGYIISLIGIIVLAISVKPIKESSLLGPLSSFILTIPNLYFIVVGFVILIFGVIMLRGTSSGKQPKEVPIYQGKNVVGFRRFGKK